MNTCGVQDGQIQKSFVGGNGKLRDDVTKTHLQSEQGKHSMQRYAREKSQFLTNVVNVEVVTVLLHIMKITQSRSTLNGSAMNVTGGDHGRISSVPMHFIQENAMTLDEQFADIQDRYLACFRDKYGDAWHLAAIDRFLHLHTLSPASPIWNAEEYLLLKK